MSKKRRTNMEDKKIVFNYQGYELQYSKVHYNKELGNVGTIIGVTDIQTGNKLADIARKMSDDILFNNGSISNYKSNIEINGTTYFGCWTTVVTFSDDETNRACVSINFDDFKCNSITE